MMSIRRRNWRIIEMDQEWLLGATDEDLMERIKKEVYSSLMRCRKVDPRVRVTIEVLDTDL